MRAETENTKIRELSDTDLDAVAGGGFDLGGIVGSVVGTAMGGALGGVIGSEVDKNTVVVGTCHK